MPTTKPRYTVTDTGDVETMLDLAQRRWPEVADRRELLLRLAQAGRDAVATEVSESEQASRQARQLEAMSRAIDLVDVDVLLADDAWR